LVNAALAVWLVAVALVRPPTPPPAPYQNYVIVGLLLLMFAVVFFSWLAMRLAVNNDERIAQDRPPAEADPEEEEKVFVWPDLVYTEFMCVLVISVFLVAWSVLIPAPLEEPANPQLTPNPSKAPWYFLGLQEILVYFPGSPAW